MTTKKYKFICQQTPSIYDEKTLLKPMNFYQICGFPNPKTHRYEMRDVFVNEYDEITKYRTLYLLPSEYQRLLRNLRDNKYRMYSTYTLDYIDLPACHDITLSRSEILNNDSEYSGFAQFNGGQEFNWRGTVP
jgi:hypothetical protein